MTRYGFTLIELLIVVAIIGILASIAVPNLFQAQMQAKISRIYSDMRTVGTALELYHLDYKAYPRQGPLNTCSYSLWGVPELTTPLSYIASFPDDLFHKDSSGILQPIKYGICNSSKKYWYLWSIGPDRKNQFATQIYDVSNGMLSLGDLKRTTAMNLNNTNPQ